MGTPKVNIFLYSTKILNDKIFLIKIAKFHTRGDFVSRFMLGVPKLHIKVEIKCCHVIFH
jgi:hypothetical protein